MSNFELPGLPDDQPIVEEAASDIEIPFQGALTVKEVHEAISLVTPLGNKIAAWVVKLIFAAACLYLFWFAWVTYREGNLIMSRVALGAAAVLLIPNTLSIYRPLRDRRRARKMCEEGRGIYAPSEGRVDDQGIHSKSPQAVSTFLWQGLAGFWASERVVVIVQRDNPVTLFISRSKFKNDEDWSKFLNLLSDRLHRL